MKTYFFKVTKESSKFRVRLFPGQKNESGADLTETLNVSCPKDIRVSESDILYSTSIKLSKSSKYYISKGIKVLTSTSDTKIIEEYEKFSGKKFIAEKPLFEIISTDKSLQPPTSNIDGFYVDKDNWGTLVRNVKRHINTLIIGPTGTGKTSVVKELCNRLGIELYIFDMGSMIDPISSLLGVHRLEKGESIFDYAKFTQVIQKPCVILLDELSRCSMSVNNILFPCLDDRRSLSIEIAGSKDVREILVHPEVTFIATANVGSEYTGTNSMDRALVNRFFPVELGNIPTSEEEKVLITRTNIPVDKSKLIVKVANNIRSLFNKQEVSVSLSIRETLMVANLVHDGLDIGKAMEMIYLPLYEGNKNEGERSTIYKTIITY